MLITDPVADMLTRIRNANKALHDHVEMPTSRLKERDRPHPQGGGLRARLPRREDEATALQDARHRAQVRPQPRARAHRAEAHLEARPAHLRRKDRLPRVLGGMGTAILSTSRGVITSRTAEREGLGGEVICFVW